MNILTSQVDDAVMDRIHRCNMQHGAMSFVHSSCMLEKLNIMPVALYQFAQHCYRGILPPDMVDERQQEAACNPELQPEEGDKQVYRRNDPDAPRPLLNFSQDRCSAERGRPARR